MIKAYIKYLKDNPQGYWFKAKLYGWGWEPATWQGWAVVLAHIVAITLLALTIDASSRPVDIALTFVLPVLALTAVVLGICYKKGEKPRWQWGPPKK